ncbi:hypothetical protein [Nocardia aurantiaca]|uniref:Uncharacterized protein n=1 Tax=Nocardia aurantiaca TaxID=2675850 RepID=A0A6I3KY90_9NOCA|nr:hypothetical protein [Nocardia aurantiaca]MTE15072.1 hypothetical protein [Nocardia aurantiaca]
MTGLCSRRRPLVIADAVRPAVAAPVMVSVPAATEAQAGPHFVVRGLP